MPLAWKDGHLLWRNGHLAWSPDCCCGGGGGPINTGCCPDPVPATLTLQEVFTGSTTAPLVYVGLDGFGRHYWQGTLKGCLITFTCSGGGQFLWSGGTITDATFNPFGSCSPFHWGYGAPNCSPSVFFEVVP